MQTLSPSKLSSVKADPVLAAAASTMRSGLGQSICIGVGGDVLPGTTLTDGLRVLVEDKDTEAIALVGEVGGDAEIEAASFIKEYYAKTKNPK